MKTVFVHLLVGLVLGSFQAMPAGGDTSEAAPELIAALRQGDDERVAAWLAAGGDASASDSLGRNLLMYAAAAGKTELMQKLLEAGVDVHTRDQAGNTALFFLPEGGHPAGVQLLLEHGALANDRNQLGHSPLRAASLLGHTRIVQLLLSRGASVADDIGRDALNQAVLNGRFDTAKLLLEAGAEVDEDQGRDGRGLLYRLAEKGRAEAVSLLLGPFPWGDGAKVDTRVSRKECCVRETPLMAAVKNGHVDVARRLLAAGADVEAVSAAGWTPLLLAARENQPSLIELLLGQEIDIEGLGGVESESTALLVAAQRGHLEAARALLARGAEINARNRSGISPLMFAASQGAAPMAELFLAAGAEVDASNYEGATALFFAVFNRHPSVARLLLERGARLDMEARVKDFGRVGPLMMAIGRGQAEMVRLLLDHGADPEKTASLEELGRATPLMAASFGGLAEVVRILLDAGADPSTTQGNGDTALSWARKQGHDEIVLLLEAAIPSQQPSEIKTQGLHPGLS